MGHVRLGKLPTTRGWPQVVELLASGADAPDIAAAIAKAADKQLKLAHGDPVLANAVWLLTQLPLAARSNRFAAKLAALGCGAGSEQSLLSITAGLSAAIDHQSAGMPGQTDLGVMARQAAAESLATLVGDQMPGLFGSSADDVRIELGKFATKAGFAHLARDFFSRLTFKTLDYYVSRVAADHIGPERTLSSLGDHARFQQALELHCRETSAIVEEFAGGWFSRANFQDRLTPQSSRRFADYALKKMREELRARSSGDG